LEAQRGLFFAWALSAQSLKITQGARGTETTAAVNAQGKRAKKRQKNSAVMTTFTVLMMVRT